MLVAEVQDGKIVKLYRDENQVVKLGAGVGQTKRISNESLQRARVCFEKYRKIVQDEKPAAVVAVATSASRDAVNRGNFEALALEYGFRVQTITGQREAAVTFRGATFDIENPLDHVVVDVGGGSTEIMGADAQGVLTGNSLDVGSVRLTDQFFPSQPPSFEQVQKLQSWLTNMFLQASKSFPRNKTVIAVAGTPTSLACLEHAQPYNEEFVHKSHLSLEILQSWILKLFPLPVSEREKLPGMPAGRSDVLVAGTCILAAAVRSLNAREVIVSTKGVRFGLALEWEKFR
jgi:exopolyphosphatase/guanosine-5'-triphosphate,3'-diphosphate pyrophosphatase